VGRPVGGVEGLRLGGIVGLALGAGLVVGAIVPMFILGAIVVVGPLEGRLVGA